MIFSLMLKINHQERLEVYLLSLIVQRSNCSSVDVIEFHTFANSVIESSFLVMEIVMINVSLSYSFNCFK